MRTTFRITEADYVNGMKLYSLMGKRYAIVFWSSVVLLHIVIALAGEMTKYTLFFGWLFGVIFYVTIRFVLGPYIARRHYRNYKSMHEEFQIELLPEGVYLTGDDFSNKVLWNKMLKWRYNDSYILIFIMPRLFYMVPASLAAQGFDTQALMAALTKNVGQPI
jgi:hypothetical protein